MWLALRAACVVQTGYPAGLVDSSRAGAARNAHVL